MYNYDNIELYEKCIDLRKQGKSQKEISNILGISRNHVKYLLGDRYKDKIETLKILKEKNERLEKDIIELLPKCNSLNDVCYHLGLRGVDGYYRKIKAVIEKYNLSTDHFGTINVYRGGYRNKFTAMSNEEFFVSNSERNGKQAIKRLIESGIKEYKCENPDCGISEWHGKPISLQLHHINGDHHDNRLENLQLLCPNCHTQTDSYAKSNKTPGKQVINNKTNLNNSKKCEHEIHFKVDIQKEDLINSIKELRSYRAVARKYGLSDNAIRKRCKRYGIMSEIEPYIIHR